MQAVDFDRDAMAAWYAEQHMKTDPAVKQVYYLPAQSPDREIRLVEVNDLIGELRDEVLEPLDFGVDVGHENAHKLFVLDVTPSQWERISRGVLPMPAGWSLADATRYLPG